MSFSVVKQIDLDFSLDTQAEVILSQHDKNSRQIIFHLFSNGKEWNHLDTSESSTMSAKVYVCKPDKVPESEVASITGANEIILTIPEKFTTTIGKVIARLTISDSDNGAVLSPLSFSIFIIS